MSGFSNEKAITEETGLSTTQQVLDLLKAVKAASRTYEKKLEAYYKEFHEVHQAEQKLIKTKRQLINIMKDNNVNQLTAGEDLRVQLVKSYSKVIINDDSLIPPQYITVKRIIDDEKVKKVLHSGKSIPGVYLDMESVELDSEIIYPK